MSFSVRDAARENPEGLALVAGSARLSWTRLAERVAAVRGKIERATHVALTPHPAPGALVRLYAALDAGVPVVLLHPRLTAPERRALLSGIASDLASLPSGTAAVVFTSGTSGRPKAVVLGRSALAASAAASAAVLGWRPGDRWLLALPAAHVGGLSVITRCLLSRATVVVGEATAPAMEAGGVTLASFVPAQLARVLDAGHAPPPALRAALIGGAGASRALLSGARAAGWPVHATYGLSEACSQVATERTPGGGLVPLPGIDVRVVDGLVEVRGPVLATGYLPAGDVPFAPGGWFRTGDRGRIDPDGRLVVLGRADDVIVTGGENVDPLEVEHALTACPGVREALVVGVPDPVFGARVAALVVPAGRGPTDADLAAHAAARLAPFKRPRLVVRVDRLPLTEAGKPDRAAARARAADLRPPDAGGKPQE